MLGDCIGIKITSANGRRSPKKWAKESPYEGILEAGPLIQVEVLRDDPSTDGRKRRLLLRD